MTTTALGNKCVPRTYYTHIYDCQSIRTSIRASGRRSLGFHVPHTFHVLCRGRRARAFCGCDCWAWDEIVSMCVRQWRRCEANEVENRSFSNWSAPRTHTYTLHGSQHVCARGSWLCVCVGVGVQLGWCGAAVFITNDLVKWQRGCRNHFALKDSRMCFCALDRVCDTENKFKSWISTSPEKHSKYQQLYIHNFFLNWNEILF